MFVSVGKSTRRASASRLKAHPLAIALFGLFFVIVFARSGAAAAQTSDLQHWVEHVCSKRCAATLLMGVQLDTDMEEVFVARGRFTPPWEYNFSKGFFLGGAISRELFDFYDLIGVEAEVGVGQRFGTLHETEVWGAAYLRWKYFPWNHYLRTTVAVSTGVNYASGVPAYEIAHSGNNKGSKALHYFSPEITFAFPSTPDNELVFRIHHRSGGQNWWGESHPIFGNLFGNTGGGVQYLTAGIRHRF